MQEGFNRRVALDMCVDDIRLMDQIINNMKKIKLFFLLGLLFFFSAMRVFSQHNKDEINASGVLKKSKLLWKMSNSYTVFSYQHTNDMVTGVLSPIDLGGWQQEASLKSGGDGRVGFLKQGYIHQQNPRLYVNKFFTLAIRLRSESGKWNCGVLSIDDLKGHSLVDFHVQDTGKGAELIVELNIKGQKSAVRLGTSLKKIREDIWHSFVLTFDGRYAVLYVNNEPAARIEAEGSMDTEGVLFSIGKSRLEKESFTGMIDYAAFWDGLLSTEEICKLSLKSHEEELAMAQESMEVFKDKVAADPYHPVFHLAPPSRLMNDPNGPIFFNGKYHLFYQFFPYWQTSEYMAPGWGHAVSTDLVHWEHKPIALMPIPGNYDGAAIASGGAVINNEGIPTIVYTSASPQTQSLAMSSDDMNTWTRYPGNPVIGNMPGLKNIDEGFRDPFVWKENEYWFMALGSGIKNTGGTVLLYRSRDLYEWEFLNQLATGMGKECFQWECPNFFKLGDKYVLIVSPLFKNKPGLREDAQYAIGKFDGRRFTRQGDWKKVDHGGPGKYYAPNSLTDVQGRRIMWGVLPIVADGWAGLFSLPRVLNLDEQKVLRMEPLPELSKLRRREWIFNQLRLDGGSVFNPEGASGRSLELKVRFDRSNIEGKIGVDVFCSKDFEEKTSIVFDSKANLLRVGDTELSFRFLKGETMLDLHIFIDRSVIEVFVNNRECITHFVRPSLSSDGIRLTNEGKSPVAGSLNVWELDAIMK